MSCKKLTPYIVGIIALIAVVVIVWGWNNDNKYGNSRGPYPVITQLELPENYSYRDGSIYDYNRCHFYGPATLTLLAQEEDQVAWEYRRTSEDSHYHECEQGRRFESLRAWNLFSIEVQAAIDEHLEETRATAIEEDRIRRLRERLSKQADQTEP